MRGVCGCCGFFIHAYVEDIARQVGFILTLCYGSPHAAQRHLVWDQLRNLSVDMNSAWIVMGDFNIYCEVEEKSGSNFHNWASIQSFKDCLHDCGLLDLGFNGPRFTWERGST